jgi:hypothetical protein
MIKLIEEKCGYIRKGKRRRPSKKKKDREIPVYENITNKKHYEIDVK